MIWNREGNLSIVELGAINGIVFGSLLELSLRAIYLYEKYLFDQTSLPAGLHIHITSYPFSWWFLPAISFVFVTSASYIVNRYLNKRIKSQLWLWQVVGLVAVFEACLHLVVMILYHWHFGEFNFLGIDYLTDVITRELSFVLRVLPLVICFNLLFIIILRVWKKRLL